MDPVQEIKSRLTISDVARDYGSLHPGGAPGKFKMVCPFHDDHDPSMVINEQKGFAWCFVCNSGGDIFSFVQRVENCSFPEALRMLAEKASVEMKDYKPDPKAKDEKERLFELMEAATIYFEKQLAANEKATAILATRKMPPEILQRFRVGYAPDSGHGLEKALLEQGFSRKEMLQAGLLMTEDSRGANTKDKFRNRIMFPIWNNRGRICAFGGRYIGDYANAPKYLNSPETILYKKSEVLYGYNFAKDQIREQKFTILTEGYFDVLACFAAGFQNTVAVSGTAFTDGHAKLLGRTGTSVAMALDVDVAGQTAARRASIIALRNRLEIEIISIPGGKDPDEACRDEPEQFKNAVNARQPFMEAFISRSLLHRDPQKLDDKKRILDELLPVFDAIPRMIEKDHYVKSLAEKLGTNPQVLQEELKYFSKFTTPEPPKKIPQKQERKMSALEYILGMALSWPELFVKVKEHLLIDLLPENEEKMIYKIIDQYYTQHGNLSPEKIWGHISQPEAEKWQAVAIYSEEKLGNFPETLREQELLKLITKLNLSLIPRKMNELGGMLRAGSGDKSQLMSQINELTKLLHKFHQQ